MYSGKMPFWDGSMLGFDENNKKKFLRNPEFPKYLCTSNVVTVNWCLEKTERGIDAPK
jgi:hypothetical protein